MCYTVSPKAVSFHAEAQTFIRAAQHAQIPLLSNQMIPFSPLCLAFTVWPIMEFVFLYLHLTCLHFSGFMLPIQQNTSGIPEFQSSEPL